MKTSVFSTASLRSSHFPCYFFHQVIMPAPETGVASLKHSENPHPRNKNTLKEKLSSKPAFYLQL